MSSINNEGGEITQIDAKTYKIGRDHNVSESEKHDHKQDDTCSNSDSEKDDNTDRSGNNNAGDNNGNKNNAKAHKSDEHEKCFQKAKAQVAKTEEETTGKDGGSLRLKL